MKTAALKAEEVMSKGAFRKGCAAGARGKCHWWAYYKEDGETVFLEIGEWPGYEGIERDVSVPDHVTEVVFGCSNERHTAQAV